MSGDGQDTAIERIERALARIEAASVAPRHHDVDPTLPLRHARLRGQVEAAIASLDEMIAVAGTHESGDD